MGAGTAKSHEAFTIAPAAAPAAPLSASLPVTSPTGDISASADNPAADGTSTAGAAPEPTTTSAAAAGGVAGVDSTVEAEVIESEWTARQVLTPIPDELAVGDGVGVAIAVGGADFVDGSATLISYQGKGGTSHEILTCTITDDAEQKLLDALAPTDAPMVKMNVDTTVDGRLALDEDSELHEKLARVARSINHHRSGGTPIPQHTRDRLDAVTAELKTLQDSTTASTELTMLAHYADAAAQCQQRLQPDFDTPYAEGGKIPMINPYEHHGAATITASVPDPNYTHEGLNVTSRPLSRIKPSLGDDGVATWNGTSRRKSPDGGTELAIDIGDGYTAVVRPGSHNPVGTTDYSLRNTVEIIAPAGSGHQHDLVAQLGKLNLVNRPMSHAEAEWTYLQRNIYAHQLEKHPAVTAALDQAAGLEDAHVQSLLTQRAHHTAGMDTTALANFARQLQLDAEADALPDKISLLRGGVATALKKGSGAAMAASADYNPVPTRSRGWLTWGRIGQTPHNLDSTFHGKVLSHHVTGANLLAMIKSGVLASNERRKTMGIGSSVGMSENADQKTGGARSVFTRLESSHSHQGPNTLIWDKPARILSRTDWYAYQSDHYGAVVEALGFTTKGQTRNPKAVAKFGGSGNEIMIAHGLDLLGADAPSTIKCGSTLERDEIRSWLTEAGINTLAGKPIDKVVIA